MKKLLFLLAILFPLINFAQDFSYTFDLPCAKNDYTFTASGISSADSIVWNWNDGHTSSITSSPWTTDHSFTEEGVYAVEMQIYSGGIVTNTVTNNVDVYDVPNIDIIYDAPGTVCAGQDTTIVQLVAQNDLIHPSLEMIIDWGDETDNDLNQDSLNIDLQHLYYYTSCGNVENIGGTVIRDKFLIILSSTNVCTIAPEISVETVAMKSKPNIALTIDEAQYDDVLKQYFICEPQKIELINPAADSTNCLVVSNTSWEIRDANQNLVDECDNCYESFNGNFDSYSNYTISLTQDNICGSSTVETYLNVRTPPTTLFTIDEFVTCFPSNINFINKSDPSVVKSIWNFTEREKDTIVMQGVADTSYFFGDEGEYLISLKSFDGYCYGDYDSTIILDHRCLDIYVPNAFIPNSANPDLNIFKPVAQNLVKYRIDIFNMYGEHIWGSDLIENGFPAEGWDGTFNGEDCPAGTYIWKIEATISQGQFGDAVWDGAIYNDKKDKRSRAGSFILIR